LVEYDEVAEPEGGATYATVDAVLARRTASDGAEAVYQGIDDVGALVQEAGGHQPRKASYLQPVPGGGDAEGYLAVGGLYSEPDADAWQLVDTGAAAGDGAVYDEPDASPRKHSYLAPQPSAGSAYHEPDALFGTGAGDPLYDTAPDRAFPAADDGAGAGNAYETGAHLRLSFARLGSVASTSLTASGANTYE